MILPESCRDSGDVLTKHQEDNDDDDDNDNDDDDSYLTAEEEEEEDLWRLSLRKVNVGTQTDPLPSHATCCIS